MPEGLRAAFRLSPDTRIVLRGVADEPPLEEYWAYHKTDRPAEQLAKLGISLAVGPNFSVFLGVPRTDNVFNRKRQLMCLADMAEAGIERRAASRCGHAKRLEVLGDVPEHA